MRANKKLNIVLDIGKTNIKLIFFDQNNKVVKSFNSKQRSTKKHGIKVLNSPLVYEWTLQKIKTVEKKYQLNKFVCTAHALSLIHI